MGSEDEKNESGVGPLSPQPHNAPVATFRAELTLDEFRVLGECKRDLFVHPLLQLGTLEDSGSVDGPSVAERRATALTGLEDRQMIFAAAAESTVKSESQHSDSVWVVNPLLVSALMFPLVATTAIKVQSWTPKTSSQSLVGAHESLASMFTVTVDRRTGAASTDPRNETAGLLKIQVGPVLSVTDALIALIDAAPPEPPEVKPMSVRLGLVASRSIIEAIHQGDDAVVARIAQQFDAADAVGILRTLAATMEAGFHMQVSVRPGQVVRDIEWVQSTANEWVTMRLVVPDGAGEVTADLLTTEGEVDIRRDTRSLISAEIVSMMITIFDRVGHAKTARGGTDHVG